jgi:hypothetical protein
MRAIRQLSSTTPSAQDDEATLLEDDVETLAGNEATNKQTQQHSVDSYLKSWLWNDDDSFLGDIEIL